MKSTLLLGTAAILLLSGSAFAADLVVPPAAAPTVASTGWDGAYIGASVGWGWGAANYNGAVANPLSGLFVGGQIGYNFHLTDGIVAGIEGDLNWNNEQGTYPSNSTAKSRINWDGSVLARLGYDAGTWLPYIEGGVAFANENENYAFAATNVTNTYTGWTAGVGVEYKITDPLSVNLDYRYANYGSQTVNAKPVSLTNNTVRVGLNYHF